MGRFAVSLSNTVVGQYQIFGHYFTSVFEPFQRTADDFQQDGDVYVAERCVRCGCIVLAPHSTDEDESAQGCPMLHTDN